MRERKVELLWKKGVVRRYYVQGGYEIQIGRYRKADAFDKKMGNKFAWHGKWYVDWFGRKTKLFNTQKAANEYFKKLTKRLLKKSESRTRKKLTR